MRNIGFIGLGLMGSPMAKRLLNSGYKLNIWNRTKSKVISFSKVGANKVGDLNDIAKMSDVIITMLKDDDAVIEILESKKVLQSMKQYSTLIDMSSINPKTAIRHSKLANKYNVNYLDAPVSGGTIGAKKGTLAIMVGGSKNVFQKQLSLFNVLGSPTYVGKSGSGQITKLANQIIVGITIGAVSEAIILAKTAGVDPSSLLKALKGGFADSKILQIHGKRMIENNYTPGGLSVTQLKDMNNILSTAKKNNLILPLSSKVQKIFLSLVRNGNGHYDHSAFYKELKRLNKKNN
jgi:2-hydroxy-3-oxopropionate reductase|tara:strand:+ start:387 stop:1262 length:876 start_codon:yes stop_codon:yes gene_type:complete